MRVIRILETHEYVPLAALAAVRWDALLLTSPCFEVSKNVNVPAFEAKESRITLLSWNQSVRMYRR